MQIVIDIPENIYNLIAKGEESRDFVYKSDLMRAIHEGKPLPTEIQALQQIRNIVNSPVYIQEDVLRYQMICDVLNMAERSEE